jgi:16S rRNA processing protein RimM
MAHPKSEEELAVLPKASCLGVEPHSWVAVGRVLGPWGVRGWVKIEPFGGAQDSVLLQAKAWRVDPVFSGAPSRAVAMPQSLQIERVRRHGASVVAKWLGVDDREAALRFKAAEIKVQRSDFRPLPEGEFYWVDLIGCVVQNPQGDALGTVVDVMDHGAHPILETDEGVLIPFVEPYLVRVDVALRQIVADWQREWAQ